MMSLKFEFVALSKQTGQFPSCSTKKKKIKISIYLIVLRCQCFSSYFLKLFKHFACGCEFDLNMWIIDQRRSEPSP